MKFALSQARALLVGVALIVVANAVVLAGVAYNRSGEPESVLRLTERELRIRNWSWPENENSSIDLHLDWRVVPVDADDNNYYGTWYGGLHWLQPAQLRELGFDVEGNIESDQGAEHVARQPSRRVWLVLEYDGPAYQASVEHARQRAERAAALATVNAGDREFQERLDQARTAVEREERVESRLFVVDAGRYEEALRVRYPDRQRYAIVNGRLDVSVQGPVGQRRLLARVVAMDVGAIRVPHEYREIVKPFVQATGQRASREPRFSATVNFGQRFEPWIVDLAPLN